ncbi:MBL fold metallo-hydrolase, partial [Acidovorax cavernicola]
MKVLMKFKLLELQVVSRGEWAGWLLGTPYFERIRARFFADESLDALTNDLLSELVAAGAAQSDAFG